MTSGMTKENIDKQTKLSKPLVLRLYQEQRDLLDDYVKEENKILVNNGHAPKTASEYARKIFQVGLDTLELG